MGLIRFAVIKLDKDHVVFVCYVADPVVGTCTILISHNITWLYQIMNVVFFIHIHYQAKSNSSLQDSQGLFGYMKFEPLFDWVARECNSLHSLPVFLVYWRSVWLDSGCLFQLVVISGR